MKQDLETFRYQLSRRVSNEDLKLNMDALSDMLMLKFEQIEEIKQTVRDVIVYQRYFYPLQTQVMISSNLEQLEAAEQDLIFQ